MLNFTTWVQFLETWRSAIKTVLMEISIHEAQRDTINFSDMARMVITALRQDMRSRPEVYPKKVIEMKDEIADADQLKPGIFGGILAGKIGRAFPRDPDSQQEIIQHAMISFLEALPKQLATTPNIESIDLQNLGSRIAALFHSQISWKIVDYTRAYRGKTKSFTDIEDETDLDFAPEDKPSGSVSRSQWQSAINFVDEVKEAINDEIRKKTTKKEKTTQIAKKLPLLDMATSVLSVASQRMSFSPTNSDEEDDIAGDGDFYTQLANDAWDDNAKMDSGHRTNIRHWAGEKEESGRWKRSGSRYSEVKDIIAKAMYLAMDPEREGEAPEGPAKWFLTVYDGGSASAYEKEEGA